MPGGVLKETVTRRPHPGGAKGALLGLDEVAKRAWAARGDPRVRAWSLQALAEAGNPTGRRGKVDAIVRRYRRQVPYVADPVLVEFMASPVQTLCLDDHGLCMLGGDCDDAAITCMACCLSVGIEPVWAVGASYRDPTDVPTHVYFAFADDLGDKVPVDPTTQLSVGNVHPASREWWVNPTDGLDASNLSGGEFVGIAGLPAHLGSEGAMRDWNEARIGGRRVGGFGLAAFVTASQLQLDMANTVTLMDATNAGLSACGAMASSDVAAWTSIYESWQTWLAGLQECVGETFPSIHTVCVNPPYSYTITEEWAAADQALQGYQSTARTWQTKIRAACPSFEPSPQLPEPGAATTSSWLDDVKSAAKIAVGVGVTGVALYAIYEGVKLATKAA